MSVAAAPPLALPRVALARAAIGLGQGLLLWLLYSAAEAHQWPATQPFLFVPLLLVLSFVPVLAVQGLGNLRLGTWIGWLGVATVVLAGLALHDVARDAQAPSGFFLFLAPSGGNGRIGPSPTLVISVFFMLFIAHSLVSAGDADRRFVAHYPTYFDIAWKLEVQLVLAWLFVGLFWLVLWLGAELFKLVNIDAIQQLIQHRWFSQPATTLALAYALHVTDVRAGLVTGMRNLLHVLLSWLLPLAALLIAGFLLTLPFAGLTALWATRFSAQLLFAAAAILVVLINTAYREGERAPTAILRLAGTLGCVCLLPLIAIAAYSVALRVEQHGWTSDRIIGTAVLGVSACYAAGYLWAAVPRGPWLKPLERCNIVTSYVILAVMLALLTPLADPARLAVADQVARLMQGRIAPDKFDYAYLRFGSGRYGRQALDTLQHLEAGTNAAEIRRRAAQAAVQTNQFTVIPPTTAQVAAHIMVYPRDRSLPPSFLQEDWSNSPQRFMLPTCLFNAAQNCEAFLVEPGGNGGDEIILAEGAGSRRAVLFKPDSAGTWQLVGTLPWQMSCESVRDKLRSGQFTLEPSPMPELAVGDLRLALTPPPPNIRCRTVRN